MPLSFRKGIFKPRNITKYKGLNLPVYRSAWECRFMHFLDLNENIIEWVSEEPKIPYHNPNTGTTWNYHPDFVVKIKDNTIQSGYRIEMIEIKPKKQTIPPQSKKGKSKLSLLKEVQTWNMNTAKWEAAKRFCLSKGWTFKILTEDQLFG